MAAAAEKAPGGRQTLAEYAIEDYGHIRLDRIKKEFIAVCAHVGGEGCKDHRTPKQSSCLLRRQATRHELGHMVQWLRQAAAFDTRREHIQSVGIIKDAEACRCREWIQKQKDLETLLRFEAMWSDMTWEGPCTVMEAVSHK